MFWGLIMEPGRCYTQTVKVSFHISMAALDISNSNGDPAQVMCVFEGRNYLLCTLNKKDKLQCALDLNFEVGSKVSFATNGKSHVHLTGYLTSMDDDLLDEDEESAEEEEEVEIKELSNKQKKRLKKELADGPPMKKSKTEKANKVTSSLEEDSDTDDDSFDVNQAAAKAELASEEESSGVDEDEDHSTDEEAEEEEDAESGEDDSEDGAELSSLSDEEDTEEEEEVKPKQNGIVKKPNQKQKKEVEKPKEKPKDQKPKPKKVILKGGVVVEDLKEGNGDLAKPGKFVHVYYEGRLRDNNKMFDSTTKGPGFSFRLGKGEVIKGWDVGVAGMKVGGKRRITCPPQAAYGPKGSPPVIPPNSTLVFEVELKKLS